MINEVIYSILAVILFIVFIIWIVLSVKKCKKENSQNNINEETKKKNIKFQNIKIVLGIVFLIIASITMQTLKEQNIENIDFVEILSVFSSIILILLIVSFVLKYKKDKNSGDYSKEELKKKKITSILVCIAVYLILMGIIQLLKPYIDNKQETINLEEEENAIEKKQKENEMIKNLCIEKLMVTRDVFENIQSIFVDCGLGKIEYVTLIKSNIENETKFTIGITDHWGHSKIEDDDVIELILINNEKIKCIKVNGFIIYEKGKVKDFAKYYYKLTDDEKINFAFNFEETIRKNMYSPSSAIFPSYNEYSWIYEDNGYILVIGWVTGFNKFGVPIQQNFKVKINRKNNMFEIELL